MTIIGVCGRKGGSGKTTIAVHLAAELIARGKSVILVDCDTQASANHWAAPGHLPMQVEHLPLESGDEIGDWSSEIRALKANYVVLDAPPHLSAALGGVIGVSALALVPCGPSGLDLMATAETVSLIREIRAARKDNKPRIILVPNRVDMRTSTGRELEAALRDMGETIAPVIRARMAFSDAFNAGQWVGVYARHSPAHEEMTALAEFVLSQLAKR